jgi:hypothetical protein
MATKQKTKQSAAEPDTSLNPTVRAYFAKIGSRGGRRSKRVLSSEQSRDMLKVREARRAFTRFKALCFWSYDPDLKITLADVKWVAETLKKHGNREAWEVAHRLCR